MRQQPFNTQKKDINGRYYTKFSILDIKIQKVIGE